MSRPNYAELAVLVLAVGLAVGWAGTMLLVAGPRTPPMGEAQGQLLSALGGGIVAILAVYLGGMIGADRSRRRRSRNDDDDPPVDG